MSEVSIKFRKNGTRGNTKPGECINLWSPLTPDGAKGVKFNTNAQGGDGSLEFSIGDRGPEGNWPAKKKDAAEIYYGPERATQHSIMQVKRNEMEGSLDYACLGHDPHNEKRQNVLLAGTNPGWSVWGWISRCVTVGGGSWVGLGLPWINDSTRYCDIAAMAAHPAEDPIVDRKQDISQTYEQIITDSLKYCDYERGIFPGRDGHPDALGCYFYWRHRTRDKTVKWYISAEDLAGIPGGGFKVELDDSQYQNWVVVHYTDTTGADTLVTRSDAAEIAKYGVERGEPLDLRGSGMKLTPAQANQVGDIYLGISTKPIPKGSITIPLKKIQRVGGGMQWSGFVRGGDVIRVERDEYRQVDESDPIDNFNTFLVDSTAADVDAGITDLRMPNASTLETMLMDMQAA